MSDPAIIPTSMRRYLKRYVARRRRVTLLRRAGFASSFAITWVLVWALIDRLAPMPGAVRCALLVVHLCVIVAMIFDPIRAMLTRRIDWCAAAAQVERRDPRFVGRLETAVSQLFLPPTMRGSDQMLSRLVTQVDAVAAQSRSAPLVSLRIAGRSWLLALLPAILATAAFRLEWLELPTLVHRQFAPFAAIAAVTTTRLSVEPGDVDVNQGESCTIRVRAERLSSASPSIRLTSDAGETSSYAMTPGGGGEFTFVMNAIDRDWHYDITCGDAKSDTYAIRVLRRPGIVQFRARYNYPEYMHRAAVTIANTDGVLEAPVGTQAQLDLICTEPVTSAIIAIGAQQIVAHRTTAPNVYQAVVPISDSTPYQVRLVSPRGTPGVSPDSAIIRAQVDQLPQVKWLDGVNSVCIDPFDVATIRYRATDDYGVVSARASIRVNDGTARTFPVPPTDVVEIPLAEWDVTFGDVIELSIHATDARGQMATSEPMQILIAPQTVSIDQQMCAAELEQAARLAQSLTDELIEGLRSTQALAISGGNTHLSRAVDFADQLSSHLLRSMARNSRHDLTNTLMDAIDRAAIIHARCADAASVVDSSSRSKSLAGADETARALRDLLRTLAVAVGAENVRADLLNLQFLLNQAPSPKLVDAIQRAGHQLDARIGQLGIDPDDDRLMSLLDEKIRADGWIIESAQPIDWAKEARRNPPVEMILRLLSAARAEAIRIDGDLFRAADLNLAAHALINWPAEPGSFAEALASLQTEHAEQARALFRQRAGDVAEIAAFAAAATQPAEVSPSQGRTILHGSDVASLPAVLKSLQPLGGLPFVRDWINLLEQFAFDRAALISHRQARLHALHIPAIDRLLNDSADSVSDATASRRADRSTTRPAAPATGQSGGYDEPLRIYFQLLKDGK